MGEQERLFEVQPIQLPPGSAPARKRWGGRHAVAAREFCRSLLRQGPTACWRGCGRVITLDWPEKDWHVGHINGRAEGGEDMLSNYRPECRWCNLSAGGRLGASITNGRKVTVDTVRERTHKWW